jgi:hypothetical protein
MGYGKLDSDFLRTTIQNFITNFELFRNESKKNASLRTCDTKFLYSAERQVKITGAAFYQFQPHLPS